MATKELTVPSDIDQRLLCSVNFSSSQLLYRNFASRTTVLKVAKNGKDVVLKVVRKQHSSHIHQFYRSEFDILSAISHPCIVDLQSFFETKESLVLVFPLADLGDLHSLLGSRILCEFEARNFVSQALNAISYVHENFIFHGDVKPQNFLLFQHEQKILVRLTDFGFSRVLENCKDLFIPDPLIGSIGYFSPEQLNRQPTGLSSDLFSFGIVLYRLLCGFEPFQDSSEVRQLSPYGDNKVLLDGVYWEEISRDARELVLGCLEVCQSKRIKSKEALKSDWFKASHLNSVAETIDLSFWPFSKILLLDS